jgi:hypothetical protein
MSKFIGEEQLVFPGDDDDDVIQKSREYFAAFKKDVKVNEEEKTTTNAKIFVADNGLRYIWDEEEDAWVLEDDNFKLDQVIHGDDRVNRNDDDGEESEEETNKKRTNEEPENTAENKQKKKRSKKKNKKGPNNWIYITGLPADVSLQEIKEHFSKVTVIILQRAHNKLFLQFLPPPPRFPFIFF